MATPSGDRRSERGEGARMSARRPLRSAAVLVAALLVGVVFSAGAQAAPGDLDLTFSGDGKQRTDFGFGAQQRGGDRAPAGRQDRRGRRVRRGRD